MQSVDICRQLYGTSLIDVEWQIGDSNARFLFSNGSTDIFIDLARIHCFMTRKLLRSESDDDFGPDCYVYHADVVSNSSFTRSYLQKTLGLHSDVVHFDASGRNYGDSRFIDPFHLCVVCATCDIDVLCDSIVVLPAE